MFIELDMVYSILQPYESLSTNSSIHRDIKLSRKDSRPNTPISQGGAENGGQYPYVYLPLDAFLC